MTAPRKKIVSIVGARPQFIKAAPLCRALRETLTEILVHTGQHYDDNMSRLFFDEMNIPRPDYHLEVGSGGHGLQTGLMMERIETVLLKEKPDLVLVYGDTNSTLAGAVDAAKLHIPVGHVEAGLRSYNRGMPEEINRIVADHCSDLLFCPTDTAVGNLGKEGIVRGVHLTGDVMFDASLMFAEMAESRSSILRKLGITPKAYFLCTVHRAENTDDERNLRGIVEALGSLDRTVVLPLHPRTRRLFSEYRLDELLKRLPSVRIIDPVGYLDMIQLERNASAVLTDSGGVQKEAYFYRVPCITLRNETEWIETVNDGWNTLAGAGTRNILDAVQGLRPPGSQGQPFGEGRAAERIARLIHENDAI
jgi:UDP-N-acetylglucosamine 2-epimerase